MAEMLTNTGLEVTRIATFDFIPPGLVLGEVLTCVPCSHKDSLAKTTVDVGQPVPIPVVCEAGRVRAGCKVVVAPLGTILHRPNGSLKRVRRTQVRGETSAGLLCTEEDIGIVGHRPTDVMVLDTPLPPGTPAAVCFGTSQDTVLDIDITPNRADACSHWGVARDLHAVTGCSMKWPELDQLSISEEADLPLQVTVEDSEVCPRYAALVLKGVKVQPSPLWLQRHLRAIGMSVINNVVDVANFVMKELGQPLHVFDYDCLTEQRLHLQRVVKGTSFTGLDGVTRVLQGHELMVCDCQGPVSMAGVTGGMRAKVSQLTQRIVLESAYFSPVHIAQAAKRHNLHTEASFRFERGTDPNMVPKALERAVHLIKVLADAVVAGPLVDYYPVPVPDTAVDIAYERVNHLIGQQIPKPAMHQILDRLDILVKEPTPKGFLAMVPPYRVDVQREVDVVEEILRIYGYGLIVPKSKLSTAYLASVDQLSPVLQEHRIAAHLAAQGLCEIKTNPITTSTYSQKAHMPSSCVRICNPLSQVLDSMRQSLLFTGLEAVAYNLHRGHNSLKLFEIGNTYQKLGKVYLERQKLGIWFTGNKNLPSWSSLDQPVTGQDLQAAVYRLLSLYNLPRLVPSAVNHKAYASCLELSYKRQILVRMGQILPELLRAIKIDQVVFFTEIDLELLYQGGAKPLYYQPISKYPAVCRDLSLEVDKTVSFAEMQLLVQKQSMHAVRDVYVVDHYEGPQLPKGKKSYSLRFILQERHKTFKGKGIEQVMERLVHVFKTHLGAAIR